MTAISVFERGSAVRSLSVAAGQIAKLWGLGESQIGDVIGVPGTTAGRRFFAPPTLETVIVPSHPAERGALHTALAQLAEQDPLINVRQDDLRQELFVSLYGEVQKEVIGATLKNEYGIDVEFRETTTICIERLNGAGAAIELIGKAFNPFLATIGLRIEPAEVNTGIAVQLADELSSIPLYVYKSAEGFRAAIEATVRETLREGGRTAKGMQARFPKPAAIV